MTEDTKQERIVPSGGLDFLPHGHRYWMGTDNVDRQPPKDREVFRGMVFSAAVSIFVEDNVEHPVQLVFDGPVTAHDCQQFLGRDVLGKQVVADERLLGARAMGTSARGDPGHRSNPRKVLRGRQGGIAHDGGSPPFAPIVSGRFQPFGAAARSGAGKTAYHRGVQRALIFLEREDVIALPLEHARGKLAMTMQRIGGDDAALEAQQVQHFQCAQRLVASRRLARCQRHARLHCEDVDQVHRRCASTALVGAAQGLSVDGDDAGKLQTIGLRERNHEAPKSFLEGLGVEQAKDPAERVVTGNPMLQPQKASQHRFL